MKPDVYLKLYPGDWLKDTMSLDATSTGAYFLLILAHRGKPGIPNDDQTLRTIARVREADWGRVKAQISHYFQDSDGLWVNNRSVRDWYRDCAEYQAACDRTKNATSARTKNVTSNVTKTVTSDVTATQSESESESESLGTQTKRRTPTLAHVKTRGAMIGMTEADAEQFWHHFESVGWIDKNGHPIVKWESKLSTWRSNAQAKPLEAASKNGGAAHSVQQNMELQRVIAKITSIENGAASDAMGKRFHTPADLEKLQQLKQRRTELRNALGVKF